MSTGYTLTVFDRDRRRRKPLAQHAGLGSYTDALELAAVYRAIGHRGQDIAISQDAVERAS